jgi:hypothetical protein
VVALMLPMKRLLNSLNYLLRMKRMKMPPMKPLNLLLEMQHWLLLVRLC